MQCKVSELALFMCLSTGLVGCRTVGGGSLAQSKDAEQQQKISFAFICKNPGAVYSGAVLTQTPLESTASLDAGNTGKFEAVKATELTEDVLWFSFGNLQDYAFALGLPIAQIGQSAAGRAESVFIAHGQNEPEHSSLLCTFSPLRP